MLTRLIIILLTCFYSTELLAQFSRSELKGNWTTNNNDSLYYRTDTIVFYQDINHWLDIETCNLISWRTEKGKFRFIETFTCSEPGRERYQNTKEKVLVKKEDYGQVLSLKRNNSTIDRFKLLNFEVYNVDRYPHEVKKLTLLRFDELQDRKLYNLVDSIIYKVLNYQANGSSNSNVTFSDSDPDVKIVIRGHPYQENPEPLVVLNGHPLNSRDVLNEFLLVETIEIGYLTKEKAASLYGHRARNGVVLILTSPKKFKKVWKQYGG